MTIPSALTSALPPHWYRSVPRWLLTVAVFASTISISTIMLKQESSANGPLLAPGSAVSGLEAIWIGVALSSLLITWFAPRTAVWAAAFSAVAVWVVHPTVLVLAIPAVVMVALGLVTSVWHGQARAAARTWEVGHQTVVVPLNVRQALTAATKHRVLRWVATSFAYLRSTAAGTVHNPGSLASRVHRPIPPLEDPTRRTPSSPPLPRATNA